MSYSQRETDPSPPRERSVEDLWCEPGEARTFTRAEAESRLAAQVARILRLRPFPVAAQRLMRLLANPNYRTAEVAAVIESDPALAARTLAVANSALFRSQVPCHSIDLAMVRLGARNVRDIAVGVSTMALFNDTSGVGRRVRDHCVGTGAIARVVADELALGEGSTAFLAGLLHDVGRLILLQTGEMEYEGVLGMCDNVEIVEREQLGYDHAVLGGHVVREWHIPDPVAQLVAWHHEPERGFREGGATAQMLAVLRAADRVDVLLGAGEPLTPERVRSMGEEGSWTWPDLDPTDLRALWSAMADARREVLGALAG